ncbi:LysR family transcriptional regulator [Streptomyces sp. H10-C2]|uniref:LysR family transcriptional regulator n=1 Tax=unclassified Streptomyces TaxID=2593676 RepID=UPI0024B8931A|nr:MULTISPECIES: LysR family transcriptional regulator [unclassified Streptomyces]MDJ0340695.1 LysR family transcriptional regulator [Streptomyces sp. PH10-H1]MDJ0372033.1 LysR family transcriptional regulator [Streptomyces sp. H10-C2]
MDLDLAPVRAFVVTAQRLHFGRAAAELFLSQQALSKRIARLEDALGVRLFDRTGHSVGLTPAGQRFLGPAQDVVRAGEAAVAAARHSERPLRVSVWGHMFIPLRTIRTVVEQEPGLDIELSLRPGFLAALSGLRGEEIDFALGRTHGLDEPWPATLTRRLVCLDPVKAVLSEKSPLAGASALRPDDLRTSRLWFPAAMEKLEFLRSFVERFGIPGDFGGINLGLEPFLDHLRGRPEHFSLLPTDVEIPPGTGLVELPVVDPTPLYAWHVVWRAGERHQALGPLLDAFARAASTHDWLAYDPARHWLPDTDRGVL